MPPMPSASAWCSFNRTAGAVLGEALEHVELPERLRAVERSRQDTADRPLQLWAAAGRRDRRPPEVEVEVEALVVDPERTGEVERHRQDALSEAGRQMDPRLDHSLDVVIGRATRSRARAKTDKPATCMCIAGFSR